MSWKDELNAQRGVIDEIDGELAELFRRRMAAAKAVAAIKMDNNLSVWDAGREQQVVNRMMERAGGELRGEAALWTRSMLALSRSYQHRLMYGGDEVLLPPARAPKTENVTCAFQGVPGAWSEQAALHFFPEAQRKPVEYFEDVFEAVSRGEVDYGVMPIENSHTGAIGETYDLLRRHGCYIVGRTWISIRQCLLAPEGMGMEDVRVVLSHPEGFKQCRKFLYGRAWDLKSCRNTAVAAKQAAEAGDGRTAAIGSRLAGEINGLKVLAPDVMDAADNRTAFVVIASQPEYDQRSNRIAVTFSTQHRSGALGEALMAFTAGDLNMRRIESRPATGGKYRFFADLEGNILDEGVKNALHLATASTEYFEVIGCYGGREAQGEAAD